MFQYPLGPIPWSLARADGCSVKTDKSKLMHHLEGKPKPAKKPLVERSLYIIEGNAHFQAFFQLPNTFEELCHQLFMSLPKSKILHFLTDTYQEQSIKQAEQKRRDKSKPYLIQDFPFQLHQQETLYSPPFF